jgi:hypothetical protein
MKRTEILRKPAPPSLTIKVMRPKACKAPGCSNRFTPMRPMQNWCGYECAAALGLQALLKRDRVQKTEQKQASKKERAADKAKKESLKTVSDWKKEAQVAFNRFIRLRDAGKPCICCGRFGKDSGTVGGGDFDAGHYRSTGSAPHLRFNEDNCHAQLKHCNRYGAGRAVDYRIGLIARIGVARVEALESDSTTLKLSIEQLRSLRDHYRAAARQLERRDGLAN